MAGLLGAETYSRELLDGRDLVCLDIGGTCSDLGVIHDGQAEVTNEWELEHAIPLAITTLDVRSIGAGGGSLISVDEVGSLKVGPESAGSEPGPACYGRGGTEPAMTDAYVAMGLLQPDLFLGGEMRARPRRRAYARSAAVAEPPADGPRRARRGRLRDRQHQASPPRSAAMTIAPRPRPARVLAVRLRRRRADARGRGRPRARITEVVVPYFPGGFSAFGMIASRSRVEYSQATMAAARRRSGPRS